jgi:hypothetical protein
VAAAEQLFRSADSEEGKRCLATGLCAMLWLDSCALGSQGPILLNLILAGKFSDKILPFHFGPSVIKKQQTKVYMIIWDNILWLMAQRGRGNK